MNVVPCLMAVLPLKAQIVRQALRGLGEAIAGLSHLPTYDEEGSDRDRIGVPPGLWPEVVEVTEDLMGAAFVVAQEHMGNATTAQVHHDIEHLANFWKHRGEWGGQWQSAHRHTLAGIKVLNGGACPTKAPSCVGLLAELAEKALNAPFSTDVLWAAIADVP